MWVTASLLMGAAAAAGAEGSRAAVYRSGLPDEDAPLVDALAAELQAAGYSVSQVDAAGLCDPERLAPGRLDLLVLPHAGVLPARSMASLAPYLRGGGDVIALGTPLGQKPLIQFRGRWTTREECQRAEVGARPAHVLCDFTPEDISNWRRSSNHPERPATYETVGGGPGPGLGALHAVLADLNGWDVFESPNTDRPFPDGHTLTVFDAKGGPRTTRLLVEWRERDESRWMSVVPLTTQWQRYVLAPKDFRYWSSTPGRGGRGDQFNPAHAQVVSFGLAFSHTGQVGGQHEFWVGPLGTAAVTPEYEDWVAASELPALDTLSPGYKLFESHDVVRLTGQPDQVIVGAVDLPAAKVVRSPHPRAAGGGFDKGRAWRYIPLIEARTADGTWRGAPVTMLVHLAGEFKGGVWASFGIADADWYRSPAVLETIGRIARRMKEGIFLADGGTNYYTYFEDQDIMCGARVANLGPHVRRDLTARVTLIEAERGAEVFTRQWPVPLDAGQEKSVSEAWRPPAWPAGGFRVMVEIIAGDEVIDRVVHEAHAWRPRPPGRFVTVQNGEFTLDGRRWRAHGVNYMPSSGIGMEDYGYFEHWLGSRSYDPQVIQRDLERMRDVGFNSVSIFIGHESLDAQNLLDLLRRLDIAGFKANLSLRPGTPMDFQWPKIREIIEHYRLRENDTVFAYDLAWEPEFGRHEERRRWDGPWEQWIIERYGSVADAEKDWGFAVPRGERNEVTNPSRPQMETDGPWRRMVAAYRRFLDTLLYDKYASARRLVRSLDPHHLVSFRMSNAGNPTYNWDGRLAYDFPYLARAVDMLAPEAYGRIGGWEQVKPGWFTLEYARWAAPDKPMIWAEMGVSAWDLAAMTASPELLESQADFYRQFYRMMIGSGADGVFFWWYPGGFRVGENSDFGIINPDGSDRPVTQVIRQHAEEFLAGPSARPVDHWIDIDRDASAPGLAGIYAAARDEFWQAIESGRVPGLKTAGTGTDSSNCPALAVGNTPWTGSNPPKFLDAAFDTFEIRVGRNRRVPVAKGDSVKVDASRPVVARITLTNLGEAAWVAPEKSVAPGGAAGAVYVTVQGVDPLRTPISSRVPSGNSISIEEVILAHEGFHDPMDVTVSLWCEARTPFGERYRIRLLP